MYERCIINQHKFVVHAILVDCNLKCTLQTNRQFYGGWLRFLTHVSFKNRISVHIQESINQVNEKRVRLVGYY